DLHATSDRGNLTAEIAGPAVAKSAAVRGLGIIGQHDRRIERTGFGRPQLQQVIAVSEFDVRIRDIVDRQEGRGLGLEIVDLAIGTIHAACGARGTTTRFAATVFAVFAAPLLGAAAAPGRAAAR